MIEPDDAPTDHSPSTSMANATDNDAEATGEVGGAVTDHSPSTCSKAMDSEGADGTAGAKDNEVEARDNDAEDGNEARDSDADDGSSSSSGRSSDGSQQSSAVRQIARRPCHSRRMHESSLIDGSYLRFHGFS